MKRKKTPATPSAPRIFLEEVCCDQCRSKIKVRQQNHSITPKIVGDNHKDVATAILEVSNIVRITVDDHNCVFHMLIESKATPTKDFPVRSALSDWEELAEHGLIQVSRHTIINIAHMLYVKKNRFYSKYLDVGVEVTESYRDAVSEAIKFWFNIDHKFSC